MTRLGAASALVALSVAACSASDTDITVGVYSALPFNIDGAMRAVCIEVESRGLPTQRVVASVQPGVPPRRLFDFRVTPRDEDLSQPITVRVVARTRVGCALGMELARQTRVMHFIPAEQTRETMVFGDPDVPTPGNDGGVDTAPDVPVVPVDAPPMGSCPAGQSMCGAMCTNVRIDPRNCGGCGSVCPDTTYCVNGACSCPVNQFLCDMRRCTDPRYDPDWCGPGSCGRRCPDVSNGTRLCESGRCVYTCNDGYEPVGGTCVHCGRVAEPFCDRPIPCESGLTPCDGVCRDLQTDAQHCGSCTIACAAGHPCSGGICR